MKKYLLLLFVPIFFMLFAECAKEKQTTAAQTSDTLNVEYEDVSKLLNCFSGEKLLAQTSPGPCFAVTNQEDYQTGLTLGTALPKTYKCNTAPDIDFSKYSLVSINFHGGGSAPKVTFKIVKVISQRKIIVRTDVIDYVGYLNAWYLGYFYKIPNPEGFRIEFILNRTSVPDPTRPKDH